MKRTGLRIGAHSSLIFTAIIILFPFLWIVASAFKRQIEIITSKIIFTPTMINFDELLWSRTSMFFDNYINSIIVATGSTVIAVVAATAAAFSLRQKAWRHWVAPAILSFAMIYYMTPQMTLVGGVVSAFSGFGA